MAWLFCQMIEGAGDKSKQEAKSIDATADEALCVTMKGGYSRKDRKRCESEQYACRMCKPVDQFLMTRVTLHIHKAFPEW